MKIEPTSRGFLRGEFKDRNGVSCSLQESSSADGACIWLGCNDIGLKRFEPGKGWSDVALEYDAPDGIVHIANTRMHLSQEQVAELLPALAHFAAYGSLPEWVQKTGDRELDDLIASGGIADAP
jgi:hypothetical protein